jgi:hypothetical protein
MRHVLTATVRIPPRLAALATCALAACAGKPSAPAPASPRVPPPAEAVSAAAAPEIAANAGATLVFRVLPEGGRAPAAFLEVEAMRPQLRQFFGIDVTDGRALGRLGADAARPIVLSWAIVEPSALRALLASARPPARDAPFVIRFLLVVPIVDVAGAAAKLAELPLDPTCARADGDPGRWAALQARLTTPDDRRAAEDRSAAYVCRGDVTASVVRFDARRRELRWAAAFGDGSLLAAAAARPPVDPELAARLDRAGFFAARAGVFTTPTDEARASTALGLVKTRTGVGGIPEDDLREQVWRQGVWELGAPSRLVESNPRLFTDMLATDRETSWTLSAEGRTFFSSLGLTAGADAAQLRRLMAQRLKPTGLFADRKSLVRTVQEAGSGAFLLIKHFLWPHAAAFAAANPDAMPAASNRTDEGGPVELDAGAGVLRVRASGAK